VTEKDDIISAFREVLQRDPPSLPLLERCCTELLAFRQRSRAVTERELAPIDVTVTSDEEV
jgi:hypothetical protein